MFDRLPPPNSMSKIGFSFCGREPLVLQPWLAWNYADETDLKAYSNTPASFYLSLGNPMNSGICRYTQPWF